MFPELGCSGSSSPSCSSPLSLRGLSVDAIVPCVPLWSPGCTPAEAQSLRLSQLSPLSLAVCLMVSGQLSTQTCSN